MKCLLYQSEKAAIRWEEHKEPRTAFEKGRDLVQFALSSNEKERLFGEGEAKGQECLSPGMGQRPWHEGKGTDLRFTQMKESPESWIEEKW